MRRQRAGDPVERDLQGGHAVRRAGSAGVLDKQSGGGWFKIVLDPDQAEAVIRSGKLAVVLGIEVDTLFQCKTTNACTPESVARQVDKYFAMGVRHIYPTHDFDGGFGGTAIWMDFLNVGNRIIDRQWYDV
jgi:hypothetical protein